MNLRDKNNLQIIRIYLFYGFLIGVLYAFGEYFARIDSDDPQFLIPLILRTTFTATIISGTMGLFELSIKEYLFNKPFIYLVLVKAIAYTNHDHGCCHIIGYRGPWNCSIGIR